MINSSFIKNKGQLNKVADRSATPWKNKRLGQVFLRSGAASRVVARLGLSAEETVIEIGGGDGRVSALIAPLVRRLLVVEIDERFAGLLRQRFAGFANVEVIEGDILAEETQAALRAAQAEGRPVVYGSLPYYIASPILRWVAGLHERISRAHLLVQREVAERAAARPGSREYGFLSVLLQRRAEVKAGIHVGRQSFHPVPKVDSQLLTLVPKPGLDVAEEERFEHLASALFRQRRKKLRNGLRAFAGHRNSNLEEACAAAGLSLDDRPERLSPDQLYELFKLVEAAGGKV